MKHVQKTLPYLPPWQVLRIAYSMQDKEVGHAAHHQLNEMHQSVHRNLKCLFENGVELSKWSFYEKNDD